MTTDFSPAASNMVTVVRNIIEGYAMGPIRALAQEPVQNSKDARVGKRPSVEYRLHRRIGTSGQQTYMLTVTDWNTSGLGGPILTLDDIQARGSLERGDNWAAFEGMGYTKKDDADLGSRGQGKAAFLYHANLPHSGTQQDQRMLILYDTLLKGEAYRVGVRYAAPLDFVRTPPFEGQEARQTVSDCYKLSDGQVIELGLEPLTQIGTRIIVPYLSRQAVDAFHSGELHEWLQRCWWRAIQAGLTVSLVDEVGRCQFVEPPKWWKNEPWRLGAANTRAWEGKEIGDTRVKRIVLHYDATLEDRDIDGLPPQFNGVQLLRGQQWIETLTYHDDVPKDKRAGFRGFVEFDATVEKQLRKAEKPQHDGFDKRTSPLNALLPIIAERVRQFAAEMNWSGDRKVHRPPGHEEEAGLRFMRFFRSNPRTNGGLHTGATSGQGPARTVPAHTWSCELKLEFPSPRLARVDWGSYIRDVRAVVRMDPPSSGDTVELTLSIARKGAADGCVQVDRQHLSLWKGEAEASFGDFQVVKGAPAPGKLQCASGGQWALTATVISSGQVVKRASRRFSVAEDPPLRNPKPYSLSISAHNLTKQQRRLDAGDLLGVHLGLRNNTLDYRDFEVTASLGDLLLADRLPVGAAATPPGASAQPVAALQESVLINPKDEPVDSQVSVTLPKGRHLIRADLFLAGCTQPVAHASHHIDVEVDPVRKEDWPPFKLEQIEGGPHPRWQFVKRSADDWTLQFPSTYPLYEALKKGSGGNARSSDASAFVVEVCAEGLVEWALSPTSGGDFSRLDQLLGSAPEGVDQEKWEQFDESMRELALHSDGQEDWTTATRHSRECASRMLDLYEETS